MITAVLGVIRRIRRGTRGRGRQVRNQTPDVYNQLENALPLGSVTSKNDEIASVGPEGEGRRTTVFPHTWAQELVLSSAVAPVAAEEAVEEDGVLSAPSC
eukprot:9474288-Pyramimonas_sp.AAC.2